MEKVILTDEQQEIVNIIEKMKAGFRERDIDKIMSCYSPNAIVFFQPAVAVSGEQNLIDNFKNSFIANPQFEFAAFEVLVSKDIATYTSQWSMTRTVKGTIKSISATSITVLTKQQGGKWIIILDNPHGQFVINAAAACPI